MLARVIVTALVAASSAGCLDYGDKALTFVNDDAYRVSRELAEADLRARWLNASKVLLIELSLRDGQWLKDATSVTQLPDIEMVPVDVDRLGQELRAIADSMTVVAALKDGSETIARIRVEWQQACDSRSVFDAFGLGRLGWLAPMKSLTGQDPDQGVGVGVIPTGEVWSTIILSAIYTATDNVMRGLKSTSIQEQNAKLRDAQRRYFEVVPKPDELFAMSTTVCKEQQQAIQDTVAAFVELERHRRDLVDAKLRHLNSVRIVYERRWLLATRKQQPRDKSRGTLIASQIALDVEALLNELKFLRVQAEHLPGISRLVSVEELLDAVTEIQYQLAQESIRLALTRADRARLVNATLESEQWALTILRKDR